MDSSNNVGIQFTIRQYVFYAYLFRRDLTHREFTRIRAYEAQSLYATKARRTEVAKALSEGDFTVENTIGVRWRVRGYKPEAALSWRDLRIPELYTGEDSVLCWTQPYSTVLLSQLRSYYAYVGPGAHYVRYPDARIGSIYQWLRDQENDGQGRSPVDGESARIFSALLKWSYRLGSDVGCSLDAVKLRSRSNGG